MKFLLDYTVMFYPFQTLWRKNFSTHFKDDDVVAQRDKN